MLVPSRTASSLSHRPFSPSADEGQADRGRGRRPAAFAHGLATLALVFGLALLFGASSATAADKLTDAPTDEDRLIAQSLSALVEYLHVSPRELDDEISTRCFSGFLQALDPAKNYFMASDVASLKAAEKELDDQVKAGKLDFAFSTFRLFLTRVGEKLPYVDEYLAAEHDYALDEEMTVDRDAVAYATSEAESRDRWRKRMKYELLVETESGSSLEEARELLSKRYHRFARRMNQTDNDELLEMFLTSMTNGFDPHTTYMSPHTLENFEISMSLELDGIGAVLRSIDGYTTVTQVIPGGAADRDGRISADDKIVAVGEGEEGPMIDVVDQKLSDVVPRIRGKRGTKVRLQVVRGESKDRKTYLITRDKVELKDAEATGAVFENGLDPQGNPYNVGVIELPSFYRDMAAAQAGKEDFRSTTRDVRKLIEGFREKNVRALVLDLRRNGGGSLTEAIDLTGLFLDGPVVQVKTLTGEVRQYRDDDEGVVWDGPLVVVVSKFSASASEILAGAIQDYGRGLVVGDPSTHGKGTVQTLLDIADQIPKRKGQARPDNMGALKVTIQKFYRPSGASTQNRGVTSDIVLPSFTTHLGMTEGELDYALAYDTIKGAPFEKLQRVTPSIVEEVKRRSLARRAQSEDFQKLKANVDRYRQLKERKTVTLNREKYLAQKKEFDADEEEEKLVEELSDTSKEPTLERTFYLDEAMRMAVDLVEIRRKVAAK